MSPMPKITIIGAGSVEFTLDVLSNTLSFEDFDDVTVALHDIDEARLKTAGAIGGHLNKATGGRATIETFLDRRAALDGADYVINEIQVGAGRDGPQVVEEAHDGELVGEVVHHLAQRLHPRAPTGSSTGTCRPWRRTRGSCSGLGSGRRSGSPARAPGRSAADDRAPAPTGWRITSKPGWVVRYSRSAVRWSGMTIGSMVSPSRCQ